MKRRINLLPALALTSAAFLFISASSRAESLALSSPDGRTVLSFEDGGDGRLSYSLQSGGTELIDGSPLGYAGGRLTGSTRQSHQGEWRPVWGKRAVVPDTFSELTLDMGTYQVVARAYDDGVAFRYRLPERFAGKDELTRFNFGGDYTAWFYNGEHHNLGPEKLSASAGKRLPLMTVRAGKNLYMAVHEADLGEGDPMVLESARGQTAFRIASQPSEAWRVVMVGQEPGQLVDSHLIELLNPPPAKGMDFSWVKPGLAVWDWRINGAVVALGSGAAF